MLLSSAARLVQIAVWRGGGGGKQLSFLHLPTRDIIMIFWTSKLIAQHSWLPGIFD